jgi:hypothetical protein
MTSSEGEKRGVMTCRDVRDLADSFLCEELLTETNHEILRHIDGCPSCRTEIDARRRLRGAVRDAFHRAPELQPSSDFGGRLRDRLRETAAREQRSWARSRGWLAIAAGVVLTVGLAGVLLKRSFLNPSTASSDALAQDAMGDHQNCALTFRLARMPISLEDAAERFDRAYRLLLSAPPDDISTPGGPAHVVERHSCDYAGRRFGHVVMRYRGTVVSLLMTAGDRVTPADTADAIPHLIGHPIGGMSVVAVNGPHHMILLVSDVDAGELARLSKAVALPLARLDASLPDIRGTVAALERGPAQRPPSP